MQIHKPTKHEQKREPTQHERKQVLGEGDSSLVWPGVEGAPRSVQLEHFNVLFYVCEGYNLHRNKTVNPYTL